METISYFYRIRKEAKWDMDIHTAKDAEFAIKNEHHSDPGRFLMNSFNETIVDLNMTILIKCVLYLYTGDLNLWRFHVGDIKLYPSIFLYEAQYLNQLT